MNIRSSIHGVRHFIKIREHAHLQKARAEFIQNVINCIDNGTIPGLAIDPQVLRNLVD